MHDNTYFANINGKREEVLKERTYREKLIVLARTLGCETELMQIFNKYDGIMKNCTNEKERQAMAAMGVLEVHRLLDNGNLGIGGSLDIAGKTILTNKGK